MSPKRRVARVLVVGAGHNGLICAALLAQAGLSVTVLEQAPRPGGCVCTVQDSLPGFRHDRCAGFFPLTIVSPAFRELALEDDGLEWISPSLAMVHPFLDGSSISLSREIGETVATLDASAPGAGRRWRQLVELLMPNRELLIGAALARFPPVIDAARLLARLRRHALDLAPRLIGSAAALGCEVLGGTRPAAWLSGSACHSDLEPWAAGSAAIGLVLNLLGQSVGWPIARGGAGRLTELLVARIERHGGEVRCEASVERLLRRGRRAFGLALAGGEEISADAIVVTVSARPLAAMLDPGALPDRVFKRLRGWRYGPGTLKVDFALAGPVPWGAMQARRAAVVHVGGELSDLVESAHAAHAGRVTPALTLVVGQQSLFDDTRAPPGQHTLYTYARIPSDPEVPDDQLGRLVEDRIEAFAPGFRELIRARSVRSPRALERENPSLVGGDLAGGSIELDQVLLFRPAPELARYRTPLRGLYAAGASVHPGPAVHGASGAGAARAVLADSAGWPRGRIVRI